MRRFYSMTYSHVKESYSMNNTDDIIHNTENLMESKGHMKARSTGIHDLENMGDSIDSYLQKRLDPALALPYSSSDVSHNSSPRKKVSLSSPKKTIKVKVYQKSEPVLDISYSGNKRAGVLIYDKHSDVKNSSSDFCNNRRGAWSFNRSSNFGSEGERLGAVGKGMENMEEEGGVECSMCGDVGISELLFLCSKCSLRPQHTYCGRAYPNVSEEASICNWCLHEQDSSTSSVVEGQFPNPAPACVNKGYTDEALVKTVGPHGKAFDYLLLVAAQSELMPQVVSQASDEIKQANQTASMINTAVNSKIVASSVYKKANGDSDKKASWIGYTESHGSVASQARMGSDRERSMTGLVKKLNMEIQSAVNIKVEERGAVLQYAGEATPKRQRCSKGRLNEPALKCRKRGLHLSPARSNYRRYKLLADVVC